MAQPDPSPVYTVLPAKIKSGETALIFKTSDIEAAKREAIKMTSASGQQHVIFTSTAYVEDITLWPALTVDSLVLPIVV